jgi:hypothetical protein
MAAWAPRPAKMPFSRDKLAKPTLGNRGSRDDDIAYQDLVNLYSAIAKTLGFEGHIAWAEATYGDAR